MSTSAPINRRLTKKIYVGDVVIGGDAPISVQSMTNTDTCDVAALDLGNGRFYITSIGIGHALHTNRCIAADCDITNIYFFGKTTVNRR